MPDYFSFSCGCKFPILGETKEHPKIDFSPNVENINLDCDITWKLISDGNTKGCFQLESRLGQMMAKKLKPQNIEQLSALIAIIRPGCISGDTKILVGSYKHTDGRLRYKTVTIEKLFNSKIRTIISYDEQSQKLVPNKILNIFNSGVKECFKVKIQTHERKTNNQSYNWYNLECTADHQLLTIGGWIELKDIQPGTRILAIRKKGGIKKVKKKIKSRFSSKTKIDNTDGIRSYRSRCYDNYKYKCIFCDWSGASLDVNHIQGNRYVDNSVDNLCYLCPNHHREYSEGRISSEEVINAREKHRLPYSEDCKWATFVGKISTGYKKVYDISMSGPHHNFIAGNIVVHNCLEAIREGKSITNHYIDRKNGLESIDYFHPSLEPALKPSYGEMIYQEQAMQIAQDIAGFDLKEADMLRKAIGKKKPEEMAKIKTKFIDGAKKENIVNESQAEEIFGWIEKSQRYSFNKSHSVSYAINGYLSAYAKAHFPKVFFASYLKFAKDKIDPHQEIKELVRNATEMDIEVNIPDFRNLNKLFILKNQSIVFGLTDIKGVGSSVYEKIIELTKQYDVEQLSWLQTLTKILLNINSTASKALISCGAFDFYKKNRTELLFEYDICASLTNKELEKLKNIIESNNITKLKPALESLILEPKINKKRIEIIKNLIYSVIKPPYSLIDKIEWLSDSENALLGVAISCSKLDTYDISMTNTTCKTFKGCGLSQNIIIAGEVVNTNIIKTKTGKNPGQEMAFISIEDQTGMLDSVIMFPEKWLTYKTHFFPGNILVFSGNKTKSKDGLVVEKCFIPKS